MSLFDVPDNTIRVGFWYLQQMNVAIQLLMKRMAGAYEFEMFCYAVVLFRGSDEA
jgi:hypothetical protein